MKHYNYITAKILIKYNLNERERQIIIKIKNYFFNILLYYIIFYVFLSQ